MKPRTMTGFSVFVLLLMIMMMTMMMAQTSAQSKPEINAAYEPLYYKDKIYYIHKDYQLNYQTSLDTCAREGGNLVEFDDEDEFNAIVNYIETTGANNVTWAFHIGGILVGDTWVLPSTLEPLPYTGWDDGYRPDDYYGLYSCLALAQDYSGNWELYEDSWGTWVTPSISHRFICERNQTV